MLEPRVRHPRARNNSGEAMSADTNGREFMRKAIELAPICKPLKESIPKVGAVIVVNGEIIGSGRRGDGGKNDDEHAEWNALAQIEGKARLTDATLYTTLKPCTAEVRSRPLES